MVVCLKKKTLMKTIMTDAYNVLKRNFEVNLIPIGEARQLLGSRYCMNRVNLNKLICKMHREKYIIRKRGKNTGLILLDI